MINSVRRVHRDVLKSIVKSGVIWNSFVLQHLADMHGIFRFKRQTLRMYPSQVKGVDRSNWCGSSFASHLYDIAFDAPLSVSRSLSCLN